MAFADRRLFSLVIFSVLGCAGGPAPELGGAPEAGPVILRLLPAEGRAGVDYPIRVTIEGRGFAPSGNTVRFEGISLQGLPSTDGGTRIAFWAPKEVPSTGEAPPMELSPGEYMVTVTTPSGTSGPVVFTLVPGG